MASTVRYLSTTYRYVKELQLTTLGACLGFLFSASASAEAMSKSTVPADSVPCGIFALDSRNGAAGHHGESLRDANIRDYPFIRGYAWRSSWADLEPEEGQYDFSSIEHIIVKLEPLGQKLALLLRSFEPAYLGTKKDVLNWQDEDKRRGKMLRAVPWSGYLGERFKRFIEALASHQVYSSTLGRSVSLRDHPVLELVNSGVPGFGPLRQFRGRKVARLPGYTRERFVDAMLGSLHVIRGNFPRQHYLIGFWKMADGDSHPPLDEVIRLAILKEFDGIKAPKVGFFQDNLAAARSASGGELTGYPRTRFAKPLYDARNETYTGFQALQGWRKPFRNEEKVANASPADGIKFAYDTYNSRYFEIYVSDLDDPEYQKDLVQWSSRLCGPES